MASFVKDFTVLLPIYTSRGGNKVFEINFSESARICTVKNEENEAPENGDQIVKEMLKNKNIDLSRFSLIVGLMSYIAEERKEKLKVSMTCDPTDLHVKMEFQKKVDGGTYNIGEIVVP